MPRTLVLTDNPGTDADHVGRATTQLRRLYARTRDILPPTAALASDPTAAVLGHGTQYSVRLCTAASARARMSNAPAAGSGTDADALRASLASCWSSTVRNSVHGLDRRTVSCTSWCDAHMPSTSSTMESLAASVLYTLMPVNCGGLPPRLNLRGPVKGNSAESYVITSTGGLMCSGCVSLGLRAMQLESCRVKTSE